MRIAFSFLLIFVFAISYGQYSPAVGFAGTSAMHKDSNAFVSWSVQCYVSRGFQQIDDPSLGFASSGDSSKVNGKADGMTVSLGDGGEAILILSYPVFNGAGTDFAIFENGFDSSFLELAFVEVSSDGVNYFRFPSYSKTQDTSQKGSFGSLQASKLHNLAGKYQANYGTPFDLDEVPNDSLLNKKRITHIKIIDVVGNIKDEYARMDFIGNKINDPWPTPFASSGFDLDAVGLVHVDKTTGLKTITKMELAVYPNPFKDKLIINLNEDIIQVDLISLNGVSLRIYNSKELDFSFVKKGVYLLEITTKRDVYVKKVVKN